MADSDDRGGLEAFAVALQSTFPARDDASLALALLGLLSDGRAVTATTLTQTANLAEVELVVAPDGVKSSRPEDLHVSFPSPAATETANITGSFCCDVFFLAGTGAARTWRATHATGTVLDLQAAYELGCRAIEPMLVSASPAAIKISR